MVDINTDHYALGLEALKAGDSGVAIAELELASRENSADYRMFNGLAAAYASAGLFEKAIGAFKIAERLVPEVASIHFNIAQSYEAIGIPAEAEYEYGKALAIDPTYARASAALASLKARHGG